MKIRAFIRCLPFLLSPDLLLGSEKGSAVSDFVKSDIHRMWLLEQATAHTFARLPKEILNLIGQDLKTSEAVLLTNGADRKWVYFEELAPDGANTDEYAAWSFADPISALALFHKRHPVSEATIRYYLKRQNEIKSALQNKISANWLKNITNLVSKQRKQADASWHPSKAYIAGLIAYFQVVHAVTYMVPDHLLKKTRLDAHLTGPCKTRAVAKATAMAAYSFKAFDDPRIAAKGVIGGTFMNALWSAGTWAFDKWNVLYEDLDDYLTFYRVAQDLNDLAVMFSLLWLSDKGHLYVKEVFDKAYLHCPVWIDCNEVKEAVEFELDKDEVKKYAIVHVLKENLSVLEKAIMAD